ncbi:PP2C family protein-serine/threonine phosphatase [Stakelama pacifica]|uniref:Serine/threonine protein phosphatase PrpC n=1 Tax=Stakelama pacifica TaxID=517720 RepID=A0A4R6FQF6_9SPHN|nr:protein phosphatase 2C domain-containing protein [Stakelama pacifica]TDN83024.1 serine/threonine protein phosphatase PrpC [Stakelama pacifica]GGO94900.1 hypothetical protein GCM10011329_17820 [Stakelama pacifica]
MFQDRLLTWLQRPTLPRATNFLTVSSALISTDVGGTRSENQDRALAFSLPSDHPGFPAARVYIVADGMGGMRDGAACASIGVAAFAASLIAAAAQSAERALNDAALVANDAVYRFAAGKGGTTLSAMLVLQNDAPFIANVGDSRIYAFGRGRGVERLTTDDTLVEAVGGSGRELIQFVGMGEGLQPHVQQSRSEHPRYAITSDGIHYIVPETLAAVAEHAPSIRAFAERAAAAARWCGSPDNATLIAFDLSERDDRVAPRASDGIIFSDSFSSLQIVPMGDQQPRPSAASPPVLGVAESEPSAQELQPAGQRQPEQPKRRRGKSQKSKAKEPAAAVQYEIVVEQPEHGAPTDADR